MKRTAIRRATGGLWQLSGHARRCAAEPDEPRPLPELLPDHQASIRAATSRADAAAPSVPIVPGGVQPSPTL